MHDSVIKILILCMICLAGTSVVGGQDRADPSFEAAYNEWCKAIESNTFLNIPHWFATENVPVEVSNAMKRLKSLGPNMTPFLVEQLRKEENRMRLYRLVLLLSRVCGINLYYDSGYENYYSASRQMRDSFIQKWDSGEYLRASEILRQSRSTVAEDVVVNAVDPRRLSGIIIYGIYALPYIVETLRTRNSPDVFAAFLAITCQMETYRSFINKPMQQFGSRQEKMHAVRTWVAQNRQRYDRLGMLSSQIEALVANP